MRKCSKCGVERTDERKHAYCSECQREYNLAWRKANPEKVAQMLRKWAAKNPERKRALSRKSDRKRYWENPEVGRATKLAQYHANSAAWIARHNAKPHEQKKAWWRVHELTRSGRLERPKTCPKCGEAGQRIEFHHPDHSKPELVEALCSRCHGLTRRMA